jgi:hypothetical protein
MLRRGMDAEYNGLLESMQQAQQRVEGGGGGGDDDGFVVTGERGIDGEGLGGGGMDPAQLAEAAQRAAW